MFESFVNSDGCKAAMSAVANSSTFESFVNSDGCKACCSRDSCTCCLRALLIQMGVKPTKFFSVPRLTFESFVNSDGCKAMQIPVHQMDMFESFVNSDGCKALFLFILLACLFESFVNSDGCKAHTKRKRLT